MYFSLEAALDAHPDLGRATRAALERLLPGPVLAVLPGGDGMRVPRSMSRPAGARVPVLQTSANLTGGPDPRRLADVPESIRDGADLVLDGGELPGVPSTVVDLSRYEDGEWSVLREGAVPCERLARLLGASLTAHSDRAGACDRRASSAGRRTGGQPAPDPPRGAGERVVRDGREALLVLAQRQQQVGDAVGGRQVASATRTQ